MLSANSMSCAPEAAAFGGEAHTAGVLRTRAAAFSLRDELGGTLNPMKRPFRTAVIAALAPLVLVLLAACAPTVALEPAAQATNPKCADIIVRLPNAVATYPIRQTDAQATSAWGDPAAVLLRCGVTPPGPSGDICYTVKGIDWIRHKQNSHIYIFTTFGRVPATQVVIDDALTNGQGTIILAELAQAVASVPQSTTHACTDVLGSQGLPTTTPSPSPTP
jgi:hypothetical protein